MNYFGVTTCPNCGLKVSLAPTDVLQENGGYEFLCRNCKNVGALPQDFLFKQPTGRDLSIEEALQTSGRKKATPNMPKWISKLFTKDP